MSNIRQSTEEGHKKAEEASVIFRDYIHSQLEHMFNQRLWTEKPDLETKQERSEDVCDLCGGPNIVWFVDSDRWNTALNRSIIACPVCFVKEHERATGMTTMWELRPSSPFKWIEDSGRDTPFIQS